MAHYTYGLGLSSRVSTGAAAYYDFDRLGSTAGLSNAAGTYSLQGSSLGTSFTDSNVMTGNTYYYYVTTVTALSPESVKSNVVSVTTP